MTEVSGQGGSAALTAAAGLVLDAQLAAEPAAWIRLPDSAFYPPDLAASGIDLAALVVVSTPDARTAARAAERLVRSGAFGLVVVDLCPQGPRASISIPVQGRLVSLAQRHDAAIVFLTDKAAGEPSIGSMISLRAELRREPAEARAEAERPGQFRCRLALLKDKRRGPRWGHSEVVRGPAGLR